MAYQVKLESFEGPLDLLLQLVQKEELDIYAIPIVEIVRQYLEYLKEERLELEFASLFLLITATLLEIKSKRLLPVPLAEEEELSEEESRALLEEHLLEYSRYKEASLSFREWEEKMSLIYTRSLQEEVLSGEGEPFEEVSLFDLMSSLKLVLSRFSEEKVLIEREKVTIAMKIEEIMEEVTNSPEGLSFLDLFKESVSKVEVIVTFLALLELIRLKKVQARQSKIFGRIKIFALAQGKSVKREA